MCVHFVSKKEKKPIGPPNTYGFVKHAGLPILVLSCGTVYKAVAQDVIVDAMIPAHPVRSRASESFHPVLGDWTFYK